MDCDVLSKEHASLNIWLNISRAGAIRLATYFRIRYFPSYYVCIQFLFYSHTHSLTPIYLSLESFSQFEIFIENLRRNE